MKTMKAPDIMTEKPTSSPSADDWSERLFSALDQSKFTPRHARLYLVVMLSHLTDGLDLLMLGVVLPGIIQTFQLAPSQAGLLASGTFIGMSIGAMFITYLADHIGRKKAILICIGLYSILSIAAGLAQSYQSLVVLRTLQGVGLGAEVPIVLTYVLEFMPARRRGALSAAAVSLWQFSGLLGAVIAIVVIPAFTWRGMFFIAAILSVVMMAFLAFIPESVRYLVKQGRVAEAERVVRRFSSVVPDDVAITRQHAPVPSASIRNLLRGRYLRFTLGAWIMSAAWGMAYFGVSVWLPSILIKMGFTQIHSFAYTAAITGFGATGVLVSGALMERIGRRATMATCFLIGGMSMIAWGSMTTPLGILFFGMLTTFAGTGGVAGCLFTYICEIYPTQYRASGSGLATVWQRIGGAIAPVVLGALVGSKGAMSDSFLLLGAILIGGAIAALLFTYETRGRSLEEITADLARA
jgi:putative MFS transporter